MREQFMQLLQQRMPQLGNMRQMMSRPGIMQPQGVTPNTQGAAGISNQPGDWAWNTAANNARVSGSEPGRYQPGVQGAPGGAAIPGGTWFPPGTPDPFEMRSYRVAPPTAAAMNNMPRAATGGEFDPSAQAQTSFGGGNTSPIISIRKYTPEQIAGLPAVQNLIGGNRNQPAFGQPAIPIGNPDVGLSNVSPFINMQRYMDLDDTGQDIVYSLFQQGLEQDMRDVARRSLAAAPGVSNWQQGMARVG